MKFGNKNTEFYIYICFYLFLLQNLWAVGDKADVDAEQMLEAAQRVGSSLLTHPFLSVQSPREEEAGAGAVSEAHANTAPNRLAWRVGMRASNRSPGVGGFGEELKTRQLQCHFRCSMDFLARSGLVDARAKPRYALAPPLFPPFRDTTFLLFQDLVIAPSLPPSAGPNSKHFLGELRFTAGVLRGW
jgi:hypothetical protein